MIQIKHVPATYVAQTWPLVEKYVKSAMQYGHGDYTIDQIKLLVHVGQWLLMVAVDEQDAIHGAVTASFLNYPNDRVAFITFIGGELISNKDTFKQLCDILKSNGATKIQGYVRPAVARLSKKYGFKERTTLVEVKI